MISLMFSNDTYLSEITKRRNHLDCNCTVFSDFLHCIRYDIANRLVAIRRNSGNLAPTHRPQVLTLHRGNQNRRHCAISHISKTFTYFKLINTF